MGLYVELARLVDDMYEAHQTMIDRATLERILHRHPDEHLRPDILAGDQLTRIGPP